jgi:hypothetical protein
MLFAGLAMSLSGGPVTTLAVDQPSPVAIAVDGTNAYFATWGPDYDPYYQSRAGGLSSDGRVLSVSLTGGPVATLVAGIQMPIWSRIATDGSFVYRDYLSAPFDAGTLPSIAAFHTAKVPVGGGPVSNAPLARYSRGLATVTDSANAYWIDILNSSINRSALDGSSPQTLLTQLRQISFTPNDGYGIDTFGMATDGANLYFTTYYGRIAKIPVNGGAAEIIGSGYGHAYGVAADATSVYFTTEDIGGSVWKITPK